MTFTIFLNLQDMYVDFLSDVRALNLYMELDEIVRGDFNAAIMALASQPINVMTSDVKSEIVKRLGIVQYLDEIIGGNDGFPLKPDPAVLFYLMKKYNASPANSWVLGDNHTDMNSASNAGVNGAYATWGYGFPAESVFKIEVDSFEQFTRYLLNLYEMQ